MWILNSNVNRLLSTTSTPPSSLFMLSIKFSNLPLSPACCLQHRMIQDNQKEQWDCCATATILLSPLQLERLRLLLKWKHRLLFICVDFTCPSTGYPIYFKYDWKWKTPVFDAKTLTFMCCIELKHSFYASYHVQNLFQVAPSFRSVLHMQGGSWEIWGGGVMLGRDCF